MHDESKYPDEERHAFAARRDKDEYKQPSRSPPRSAPPTAASFPAPAPIELAAVAQPSAAVPTTMLPTEPELSTSSNVCRWHGDDSVEEKHGMLHTYASQPPTLARDPPDDAGPPGPPHHRRSHTVSISGSAGRPAPHSYERRPSLSQARRPGRTRAQSFGSAEDEPSIVRYHHGHTHDDVDLSPLAPKHLQDTHEALQPIGPPTTTEKEAGVLPPKDEAHAKALGVADITRGLSAATVESQRAEHGWNETTQEQTPLWKLFLLKFVGATPFMIIAAMAISFGLQKWVDGGVIGALLLVNAIIAFREDVRAKKALNELMKKLQVMARAKRDGEWKEIPARELVPGDLSRLRTGDIVGADCILVNGTLQVDQSALTGESALKNMQKSSLLYAGSVVKRGEANAIVVAIGVHTYFGSATQLVQSSKPNPHIKRLLNRIVLMLMSLVLCLIVVSFIVMAVRGDDLVDAIPLLLMVIITALPVALPAMFTVSMALGSQELSEKAVLVTRLDVLEDCALMSILFSDKTGTLTQNHLSVKAVRAFAPNVSQIEILLTAALCSRAENADPIDTAVLEAYQTEIHLKKTAGVKLTHLPHTDVEHYEALKFVPFDASNRRTEALVRYAPIGRNTSDDDATYLVTKGAAATLAALAGIPKNSEAWKAMDDMCTEWAAKGYRTIGVARGLTSGQQTSPIGSPAPPGKFELLGLMALFDPPREDSKAVVTQLRALGIQTKMLTGDAMGVACSIGHELGMGRGFVNLEHEKEARKKRHAEHGTILLPEETAEKPETRVNIKDDADHAAKKANKNNSAKEAAESTLDDQIMTHLLEVHDPLAISGFAQIFPADKWSIVKHTQERGYICGMTGDGVNDAPALKQAEVGCAVSNATDVAKGSASAILLNEGLSGVVDMVHVGRQIHRRVEIWVMAKMSKASQQSCFILIYFLAIGRFPISALGVVLLLLLMDFVVISLATDRQPSGSKPQTWDLWRLFRTGLTVGLPGAGEMMALIINFERQFAFSDAWLETFAFELMFFFGTLTVFSVREKSFFWKSWPSTIMLSIIVVECIVVWIVCAVGFSGFEGLGWMWSSVVFAIVFGCFVVNDAIKTLFIWATEEPDREPQWDAYEEKKPSATAAKETQLPETAAAGEKTKQLPQPALVDSDAVTVNSAERPEDPEHDHEAAANATRNRIEQPRCR